MREEITLKLEKETWIKMLDDSFKKVGADAKVDGFRKGKVPKDVYIKHYGMSDLINDAATDAINNKIKEVIEEGKIIPVIEPTVEPIKLDGENFEVKIILVTEPKIKLGEYKNLGIKKDTVKVSKKEIEEHIDKLREKFAEIETKDGKVESGDIAIIDYEGFNDGVAFDGGKAENYELTIGSNTFIPGFEDAIIGMKKGEEKDINLTFPEEYHSEELKGKDVVFKVKVNEIKARVLPEMDKEFFMDLDMENVDSKESLEKQVEKELKENKAKEVERSYEDKVFAKAIENGKFEIDDLIVHDEAHRMFEEYMNNMAMYGMDEEMFLKYSGKTKEEFIHSMEGEALKQLQVRYLLKAVIDTEKLEASSKEIDEEIKKLAERYNMTEEEIIKEIGEKEAVKYNVLVNKAIDIIKENEK